jgi:hypothetical protein
VKRWAGSFLQLRYPIHCCCNAVGIHRAVSGMARLPGGWGGVRWGRSLPALPFPPPRNVEPKGGAPRCSTRSSPFAIAGESPFTAQRLSSVGPRNTSASVPPSAFVGHAGVRWAPARFRLSLPESNCHPRLPAVGRAHGNLVRRRGSGGGIVSTRPRGSHIEFRTEDHLRA